MTEIFISHSHKDKIFARRFASDLEASGISCWVDDFEIKLGESIIDRIAVGVSESRFLAAILSKASVCSSWVQTELKLAMNREASKGEIVVLPLLLEDCELPAYLEGKKYADFREGANYWRSLSSVVESVGQPRPRKKRGPAVCQMSGYCQIDGIDMDLQKRAALQPDVGCVIFEIPDNHGWIQPEELDFLRQVAKTGVHVVVVDNRRFMQYEYEAEFSQIQQELIVLSSSSAPFTVNEIRGYCIACFVSESKDEFEDRLNERY